ncbi:MULTISPECIES: YdcH family protein [unclassified Brevundimonas]|jgi:hypothetical protein|uniref:YdcH family protein n=1 Tax=unclassified Brevundimonas TaxID=2622653 RepID=UPI000C37A48B|nr:MULTISPECIES: DUF465 domain-containing protein [unclassified Brevundimonas]MAL87399.1 hypothetical protein [Brevundimonas sp.]HAJ03266.1 hypothetical protein [Brevundimonas sp.]HAV50763.1 hypothetical protein [Brevundimonas sp.]|tara:strand:+ start:4747 stop:4968 length:222 start_codon:yes stop_codon:yes gene_type:complete
MNDDASLTEEELALHIQLRGLRREHADLDAAIEALGAIAVPDQLRIARLKRQKLALRDEIVKIEARILPDIIA